MRVMKLLSLLLLALLLALTAVFFAGCGGGSGGGADESGIQEKSLMDVPEVVNTAKQGASNAAREANLRTIDSAVQAFYATEGVYPTNVNQLVPAYLRTVPVDPLGGTYYIASEGGVARAAVR